MARTNFEELNETNHWLRRAYSHKLLSPSMVKRLKPILDELAPRLNAYLRSIGSPSGFRPGWERLTTDHGQQTTDNGRRTANGFERGLVRQPHW